MIRHHHPMGLSTGVAGRGDDWPALVQAACSVSTHAIELAAHDASELAGLVAYLAGRPRLPFRRISVHTPIKSAAPATGATARGAAPAAIVRPALGSDAERVEALLALPADVRTLIAHPDLVVDPEPWRALGRRVVFENMDDRKAGGRTADELEPLFAALPEAGFCLDIAHAHTVDPSMAVAGELLDRFCGRLREVHLSSIRYGAHTTLTPEDESLFAPVLSRCRDVPWILEAAPPARWSARARLPMRSVGGRLAA